MDGAVLHHGTGRQQVIQLRYLKRTEMSRKAGSYDAGYVNSHKNQRIVLPEPCLPNGQRPDFGNGNIGGNSNRRQRSQKPKRDKAEPKKDKAEPKKKLDKSDKAVKSSKSPLSSPRSAAVEVKKGVKNYTYNDSNRNKPPRPSGTPVQVAGSSFKSSPDPRMLSKPSFL